MRTTPPEPLSHASADVRYLSAITEQLGELQNEQERDEHGVLRADRFACETACELLTNAAIILAREYKFVIPYGCASTDSEGGVRIEWIRPTCGVRLVVPAAPVEAYIYHEVGDTFDTEPATAETLAHWLREIA
jgi:hypothetical protein